MGLNKGKVIVVGFFLIAVIFGSWALKTYWSSDCQEEDLRICSLLSQLKIHNSTRLHGTYVELHNTVPIYGVEWAIDATLQEILQKEGKDENMHLIYTNDSIYLRDYLDGKWWKQSLHVVEKFDTKLPFNPTIFFHNLREDVQNLQSSLSFTRQDICGAKTCDVYTLKKKSNQTTEFYLDEKQAQIQQIFINEGDIDQQIKFEYEDFAIEVPNTNIKIASSSQNIFFENFLQQSSIQKTKPNYIKEFEETRIQTEQENIAGESDFSIISP